MLGPMENQKNKKLVVGEKLESRFAENLPDILLLKSSERKFAIDKGRYTTNLIATQLKRANLMTRLNRLWATQLSYVTGSRVHVQTHSRTTLHSALSGESAFRWDKSCWFRPALGS